MVLSLNLRIMLQILDDLLILHVLLSQILENLRVNFGLHHLTLQEDPKSLRLLNIQGQFLLILFDLGEFKGLFQVTHFFVFCKELIIQLLHLNLELGNMTVLVGQGTRTLRDFRHGTGRRDLNLRLLEVLGHALRVVDFTSLKFLQEVFGRIT